MYIIMYFFFPGTKKCIPTLVLNELKATQRQVRTLRRNIKKLREKALSFKGRLDKAEKVNNTAAFQRITKKMTTPAKLFTYMQFRHTAKKPKGRRFSLEEKVLSLSIFKRSPKPEHFTIKVFYIAIVEMYEETSRGYKTRSWP